MSHPVRIHLILQCLVPSIILSAAAADCFSGPPQPSTRSIVEDALRDLNADSRAVRHAAEQRLLELGPAALEHFPPLDLIEPVAARDAVQRIRRTLELQAAEESVQPSRATLLGDKPLRDHVRDLEHQTGNRVIVDDDVQAQRVILELQDRTFWDCVSAVCEATELGWEFQTSPPVVLIRPGANPAPMAATTDSAYRTVLDAVTFRSGIARLRFELLAEPRLRPLFVRVADADFTVSSGDETWRRLSPSAKREFPLTSGGAAAFTVLVRVPDDVRLPNSMDVSGRIMVETAARPTEFRFRVPESNLPIERRRGGVTVRLESFRLSTSSGDRQSARFTLSVFYESGGPAFESHRTWVFGNECCLEIPEGDRYPVEPSYETLRQGDGEVTIRYRVEDLPDPLPRDLEVVYIAPALVVDVPVEFGWKSVAIPE